MNRMKVFVILFFFVLCAHVVAGDDLDQCICWDSTRNTWCGGTNFWRDSCSRYVWNTFYWTIPAVCLLFGYLFFPFVFVFARCCCNGCGGGNAARALCCPRTTDEAKNYKNRSIFVTKLFYCVTFGFFIYYAVGAFVNSHSARNTTIDVLNDVQSSVDQICSDLGTAYFTVANISGSGASFISPNDLSTFQTSFNLAQSRRDQIVRVLHDISEGETDQNLGVEQNVYRAPSIVLTLLLITFVLMLCNCRGKSVLAVGLLVSWAMVLVSALFIYIAIVARSSVVICDHYNTSIIPTIVGAVSSAGGCGTQQKVLSSAILFSEKYFSNVCQDKGLAALCTDYFQCDPMDIQTLCFPSDTRAYSALNVSAQAQSLNALILNAWTLPSASCTNPDNVTSTQCTVVQCSEHCTNPTAKLAAQTVADFYAEYGANMTFLLEDFLPSYADCSILTNAFYSNGIYHTFCYDFTTKYTTLAIVFLAMTVLGIPAVVLHVVGAKRFLPMTRLQYGDQLSQQGLLASQEPYQATPQYGGTQRDVGGLPQNVSNYGNNVAAPLGYTVGEKTDLEQAPPPPAPNIIYALLVEDAADAAVVGRPLLDGDGNLQQHQHNVPHPVVPGAAARHINNTSSGTFSAGGSMTVLQ